MTLTGLMIGGAAYFWQAILGFFAGLTRKLGGETASVFATPARYTDASLTPASRR